MISPPRWLTVLCARLIAGCAALRPVSAPLPPPADGGFGEPLPFAEPDRGFDRLFTRFGGGWTGGDGTYSIGLPGGRTLWMFGDTFLGRVHPDRTRPVDTPLINNCFVLQENGSLKTLYGGTPESPRALVAPDNGAGWYWPADGTVEGPVVRVFFRRFRRTGPDPWQFAWDGTDLVGFSLPDLSPASTGASAPGGAVMYGSSVLEMPGATYIFGTEDLQPGGLDPVVLVNLVLCGQAGRVLNFHTVHGCVFPEPLVPVFQNRCVYEAVESDDLVRTCLVELAHHVLRVGRIISGVAPHQHRES